MAGRRTLMRIGAYKAYLAGQDKLNCLNKQNIDINAYLDAGMKANAKENLAKLQKETSKPTPQTHNRKTNVVKAPPIPKKDTDYKPKGEVCFIIANGESRKDFDLHQLSNKGYVIGMNVLPIVENFWPDALVSVDIATVKWICEKIVPDKLEMWSYPRGGVKDSRVNRFQKDWGWSSGPTATRLAIEYKQFQTLYILGMDFFGITPDGKIDEKDGRKINNMFKGKERYRKANSDRTYFGNWLNQMITNTSNHPNVNFYHVVRDGQRSPNKLAQKTNWIDITYNMFQEHLSKMPKKSS